MRSLQQNLGTFLLLLCAASTAAYVHTNTISFTSGVNDIQDFKYEHEFGDWGIGFTPGLISYWQYSSYDWHFDPYRPALYASYYNRISGGFSVKPELKLGYVFSGNVPDLEFYPDRIRYEGLEISPRINFEKKFKWFTFGMYQGIGSTFYKKTLIYSNDSTSHWYSHKIAVTYGIYAGISF